jgi:paraquat-inducible protein A
MHLHRMEFMPSPPARLRECPICGLFQTMPVLERRAAACCRRCGSLLRQDRTDPAGRALALAVAALLLFALAATMPFLRLDLGEGQQTTLIAGPEALQQSGLWPLAMVVLATTMLAPLAKLGCMIWVLFALHRRPPHATESPPRHLAVLFRWVEKLTPWSMVEVFLLGVFVAYSKLIDLAPVHIGGAAYALGAVMLVMAGADAVLDHEAIWERLEPHPLPEPAPARRGPRIACDACGQVCCQTGLCPRCGALLRHRKPESLTRTWALLIAAALLYIPANTLPILTVIRLGRGMPNTILEGVEELAAAGLWPLAALVFVASVAVPVLKLVGLTILLFTTQRRMRGQLVQRTRLYKIVEAVGRWSMIDVFMISILTALVHMGALATISPGAGVICFCAVVILTMLAANSFDPRLMWDAAEPADDQEPT